MNAFLWVCYFTEVYKDPGFLPTNTLEYEEEMREASKYTHLFICIEITQRIVPIVPLFNLEVILWED